MRSPRATSPASPLRSPRREAPRPSPRARSPAESPAADVPSLDQVFPPAKKEPKEDKEDEGGEAQAPVKRAFLKRGTGKQMSGMLRRKSVPAVGGEENPDAKDAKDAKD